MSFHIETDYISAGGNRYSAAADWSRVSNLLAFGSDQNVAIWDPLNEDHYGISSLLRGHTHKVIAVRFLCLSVTHEVLVSGCAGGKINLWNCIGADRSWTSSETITAHDGTVNIIAVLPQRSLFATGGADAKIRIWRVETGGFSQICEITPNPRFIPLALALGSFSGEENIDGFFLAAAGTRNDIQIFSVQGIESIPTTKLCANLTGHEGWIRSLALRQLGTGDYLLASASQDKYIRLWRFQKDNFSFSKFSSNGSAHHNGLTAKTHAVSIPGAKFIISFEALLLGHEDWIYSADWKRTSDSLQLLTASADGSLAVWEPDPASGIWVSTSRLGEISGQKGATTATGSTGGFWIGLWSPNGLAITCLGRTGSWRIWHYGEDLQYWVQNTGISGHVDSVTDISWESDGAYVLSTSSDQTTRLHAEWKRYGKQTWHEFTRPQIHGYDLNCIVSTKSHQFCSGADEKLLRVFDTPKAVALNLQQLCMIEQPISDILPDTAAMPVLGLSNKPLDDIQNTEDDKGSSNFRVDSIDQGLASAGFQTQEPPTEDMLARHTLWPEREKLYGHGHEISEAAVSQNGLILATACKASSVDHAVIRLYDTTRWHEIKNPLSAHSLTVTRLAWSNTHDNFLLSVGRDRQWALFHQIQGDQLAWKLLQSNPKAHSRMILDATWSPTDCVMFFATAGRDKAIKIWQFDENNDKSHISLVNTITRKAAVTSISITTVSKGQLVCLAAGEEDGTISLHSLDVRLQPVPSKVIELHFSLCPSKSITRLAWRPKSTKFSLDSMGHQLAIASTDSSLRILRIDLENLCQGL